jgi:hypothetical protein
VIRTRLSARTVRDLLAYNERTGALTWRVDRSRTAKAGDDAGFVRSTDRQIIVRINGRQYLAQRLIWLYKTGEHPQGRLIFLDRDPTNLKWRNIQPEVLNLSQSKSAINQRNYRLRRAEERDRL